MSARHARCISQTEEEPDIYAIVRSGGKQYRVEAEQVLDVDRLQVEVGSTVELTDVLLISEDGLATVGTPTVPDARVLAEVIEHGRDQKVIVFKYKNKTRYRRKRGHRQDYTRLAIRSLGIGEIQAPRPQPKRPSRKKAAAKAEEEASAATAGAAAGLPDVNVATEAEEPAGGTVTAEAPAKPRRARKPSTRSSKAGETSTEGEAKE
jgi:large subunit ribosomal protein L21